MRCCEPTLTPGEAVVQIKRARCALLSLSPVAAAEVGMHRSAQMRQRLLHVHPARGRRRWRRLGRGGSKLNREPRVPAMRPVLGVEFPIALDVDVGLQRTQWDNVAKLRSDADDPRLKTSDPIACAAVTTDFIINVANQSNLKLLGQKLRRTPIEVHVDAALILGRGIDEIVSESEHSRNLVPSLRIEVGVTATGVDRA